MGDDSSRTTFKFPMVDFYTSAEECFQLTPELIDFLSSDTPFSSNDVAGRDERARVEGDVSRSANLVPTQTAAASQSATSQRGGDGHQQTAGDTNRCARTLLSDQGESASSSVINSAQVSSEVTSVNEPSTSTTDGADAQSRQQTQSGVPDDHPLIVGYDAAISSQAPATGLATPYDTLTIAPINAEQLADAFERAPSPHEVDITQHLGLRLEDLHFPPEAAAAAGARGNRQRERSRREDGSGDRKRKGTAKRQPRAPWKRAVEPAPSIHHPIYHAVWLEAPPAALTPGELELVFVWSQEKKPKGKEKEVEWAPYALRRLRISSTSELYIEYSRFQDATLYMPPMKTLEDFKNWVLDMTRAGRDLVADHRQRGIFNLPVEFNGEAFSSVTHLRTVHNQRHGLDHASYAIMLVILGRTDERCGYDEALECYACLTSPNRSQYIQHVSKCLKQFEQTKTAWEEAVGTRRWCKYENQLLANFAQKKKLVFRIARDFFGCASKDESDYMKYAPVTSSEGRAAARALLKLESGELQEARRLMPALGPARIQARARAARFDRFDVSGTPTPNVADETAGGAGGDDDDEGGDDDDDADDDDVPLSQLVRQSGDAVERYSPTPSALTPATVTEDTARASSSAVHSPARSGGQTHRVPATAPATPSGTRSVADSDVIVTGTTARRRPRTKTTQRKVVKTEQKDTICRFLSPTRVSSSPGLVVQADVHATADSRGTTPPTQSREAPAGDSLQEVPQPAESNDMVTEEMPDGQAATGTPAPTVSEPLGEAVQADAEMTEHETGGTEEQQYELQPPSPTNSQLDGMEDETHHVPPAATQHSADAAPPQPSTGATAAGEQPTASAADEVVVISDGSTAASTRPPSGAEVKVDDSSSPDDSPTATGGQGELRRVTGDSAGSEAPPSGTPTTSSVAAPQPSSDEPAAGDMSSSSGSISLTPAQFQLLVRAARMGIPPTASASAATTDATGDIAELQRMMATVVQGSGGADDIRQTLQFESPPAASRSEAPPAAETTSSAAESVTADAVPLTAETESAAARHEDVMDACSSNAVEQRASVQEDTTTMTTDITATVSSTAQMTSSTTAVSTGTTAAVIQPPRDTVVTTSQPVTVVAITPIRRVQQPLVVHLTSRVETPGIAPVRVADDEQFVTVDRTSTADDVITIDDTADYTTEAVRVPVSMAPAVRAALRAPSPVPSQQMQPPAQAVALSPRSGQPLHRPGPVVAVRPNAVIAEELSGTIITRLPRSAQAGMVRFRQAVQQYASVSALPFRQLQHAQRHRWPVAGRSASRAQQPAQEEHVNLVDSDEEVVMLDDSNATGAAAQPAPQPAAEIEVSDDTAIDTTAGEASDTDATLVGSVAAAADTPTFGTSSDRPALLATPSTSAADQSSTNLTADRTQTSADDTLRVSVDPRTGGLQESCSGRQPETNVEADIMMDVTPLPDHSYADTSRQEDTDAESEGHYYGVDDIFAFTDDESVHSEASDIQPSRAKRRLSEASETGSSPRRARLDSGPYPPAAADDTLINIVSDDADVTLTEPATGQLMGDAAPPPAAAPHREVPAESQADIGVQPATTHEQTTATAEPAASASGQEAQRAAPPADATVADESSMDTDDEIRQAREEMAAAAETSLQDEQVCVAAAEAFEASQAAELARQESGNAPAANVSTLAADADILAASGDIPPPDSQAAPLADVTQRERQQDADEQPLAADSSTTATQAAASELTTSAQPADLDTAVAGAPAGTQASTELPPQTATFDAATALSVPAPAQTQPPAPQPSTEQASGAQSTVARQGLPADPLQGLRLACEQLPAPVARNIIENATRTLNRHERGEDLQQAEEPPRESGTARRKRSTGRQRNQPMVAELHAPRRPPGPPTLLSICITTMQTQMLTRAQAMLYALPAAQRQLREAEERAAHSQQLATQMLTVTTSLQNLVRPMRRELGDMAQHLNDTRHSVDQLADTIPRLADEIAAPHNAVSSAIGTGRQVAYDASTRSYLNLPDREPDQPTDLNQ